MPSSERSLSYFLAVKWNISQSVVKHWYLSIGHCFTTSFTASSDTLVYAYLLSFGGPSQVIRSEVDLMAYLDCVDLERWHWILDEIA